MVQSGKNQPNGRAGHGRGRGALPQQIKDLDIRFSFGDNEGVMSAPFPAYAVAVVFLSLLAFSPAQAQQDIDRPPINYHTADVADAVARLQEKLDAGEEKLVWDAKHGWLPSLLGLLGIPESSQLLVFSKTSLQFTKITPHRPRALYFNDNAYIGVVQYGEVVEVSAVDAKQGAIFYTLAQKKSDSPQFLRDKGQCLACHHNHSTQGVPGYLTRSVYPGADGNPIFSLGTTTTDQTTDFRSRYGGWYVTGKHGALRHRGNAIAKKESAKSLDIEAGANLTDLAQLIETGPYLTPQSDLVALLVLEHQSQMHNYITKASYEARQADHYDEVWNKILARPADFQAEVSKRRIARAGEALLRYLLFSNEYRLTSPVEGTSGFADQFQLLGPRDRQGRSLRDFDLQTRLFKYPCSYLIYSESFDALPSEVLRYVERRLREVLTGEDASTEFAHLTAADRAAIREILIETKPSLVKVLAD